MERWGCPSPPSLPWRPWLPSEGPGGWVVSSLLHRRLSGAEGGSAVTVMWLGHDVVFCSKKSFCGGSREKLQGLVALVPGMLGCGRGRPRRVPQGPSQGFEGQRGTEGGCPEWAPGPALPLWGCSGRPPRCPHCVPSTLPSGPQDPALPLPVTAQAPPRGGSLSHQFLITLVIFFEIN